jgi:ABC-type hemin transport system ATPase subunit
MLEVSGFPLIMVLPGQQLIPLEAVSGFQWQRIQMAQKLSQLIAVVTFGLLLIQDQPGPHTE